MNHGAWILVVAAGALGLAAGIAVDHLRQAGAGAASLEAALQEPAATPRVIGTRRPTVRLPDLDGDPRALAEFDDRVILLNFWATWCPPCLEEIPALMALQDELGPEGLQVVGLALDDPQATREFVREHGVSYPILVGGESAFSLSEQFGNLPTTLPYSVVIDRTGVIRAVHRGALTRAQAAGLVRPLL